MKTKQLIRFDWAIKHLLRNKASFPVLEGFLSELLKPEFKAKGIQIISVTTNVIA